jgi:TPR repeat protein
MNRITLLPFFIFCLLGQTVYADMNSANASLARGDYAAASAEFLKLANDGNAMAQAHLGYMYYVGEGVQQDYVQAINWYRKAAVQGNRDAQYNLAVAYAFGEGTKQDYKEAATWYRRAAEQGHIIAQYSLGISYSYGEGVKQDSAEAVNWFQKSADQGYARSQVQLASKYHTGDGVALNYQQAVAWYRKAADRGNAAAQYNLGTMYRSGKGVPQDYNQAVRWYRLASDQGYAAATNELASLERAIAGATRTQTRPDLRPSRPAPAEKVVQKQEPAKEPLLTVKKDDLLSLDEEEQVEQTVMEEAEPVTEATEEAVMAETEPMTEAAEEIAAEEKKPGRVSGFFKKFFKKKEKPAEAEMLEAETETAVVDSTEPENIEEMQQDSVPVEDLSEPMSDSISADEMETEREVITNEPQEKKSRFGFFKKLFKKKETTEIASVEDHSLAEVEPETSIEVDPETAVAYGTESAVSGDEISDMTTDSSDEMETAMQEEVAETSSSDEMDALAAEEKPKKKGFFKRLFGKKKDDVETEDVVEDIADESDAMTADSIALVDDRADEVAVMEEDVAIDSSAEEDAAMDALEVEEKPEKKGFFKRLFGKKDKAEEVSEEMMAEESEVMSADSIAMVDDSADTIPVLEEEVDIDTSAEEEAAMDALEVEEKPKKKGFFGRLFGKKKDDAEAEGIAEESGEASVESAKEEYVISSSDPEFIAEESELEVAQQALDSGDYDAAYSSYYDLATQGDASAQYQLGLLYYQGLGISQNYDEASHWYKQSGTQGNADAQYSLGNMFLMGEGVNQDDSKAIAWYEKAAEQGHVAARHNADNLKRVTANESVSADEIESALENEQTEDRLDASGEVIVEEPPKKGFFGRLFGKKDESEEAATEENVAVVQGPLPEIQPEEVSEIEEAEVEVEEEVKEKKKGFFGRLFGKKDEEVLAEAETEVAESQSAPSAEVIGEPEQSFEEAIASVKEYDKGLAYSFGDGVPQDNKAAFAAFSRSAELGHAPAQYKTGVAYAYGEGVDKDSEQAVYWYKKAAEQGYVLAQRNLGVMYMSGNGIEQNKPLAFAWHSIVADSGNVMDVHRRDSLRPKLSDAELEQAESIKATLKH